MAKKLILVDEEMYRALLNKQNESSEDINYNFIKKNMENALKNPNKNLSTKKVQYQQELRRFLKARKEKASKPVNVKLSNGANVLLTRGPNPTASVLNETGDVDEQLDLNNTLNSNILNVSENEEDFTTPRMHRNPSSPSSPAAKLFNYVMRSPARFGVTTNGQILRGGKEIKNSNVLNTIFHILNDGPGTVSPHGTKTFFNKIKDDPQFRQIQEEQRTALRTPVQRGQRLQSGRGGFKPSKWK